MDGNTEFDGICRYEQNNGHLIYAIVKAENEDNAITIARFISKEAPEKILKPA